MNSTVSISPSTRNFQRSTFRRTILTHVFQSGFTPGAGVLEPGAKKKLFTLAERKGILKLIASPDGKESSLKLHQDVEMYSTLIHKGNHMIHEMKPGRRAWLHVVKGCIELNDLKLQTGDGAGFSEEIVVSFTAQEPTEILLFDLGEPIAPNVEDKTQTKAILPLPISPKNSIKKLVGRTSLAGRLLVFHQVQQLVGLQFPVERRHAHTHQVGGFPPVAVGFFQGGQDAILLHIL